MNCHHCNDPCENDQIRDGDKVFCCNGCRMVYRILSEQSPLTQENPQPGNRFAYLDAIQFKERFITFRYGNIVRVTLNLPAIHCSACIYVLENLPKIEPAVVRVRVDFFKKEATIEFDESRLTLRMLAELLSAVGYEPNMNYSLHRPEPHRIERRLYVKLGVAGFCFGNVMLFALPDYFAGGQLEPMLESVFRFLNLLLSVPVLYAASDYFTSALSGLRERYINMDVPVAIGILALFTRSVYDILSGFSPGYVDSLSGLVFFLLIGRVVQNKTYYALSFERDYRSYFPLSVQRIDRHDAGTGAAFVSLDAIQAGDRLLLRHGEIVPADSIVMSAAATADFSFVTGESHPVALRNGDRIFAGSKILGSITEVETVKTVSQSYLTQLWSQYAKREGRLTRLSSVAARYFTFIILTIAVIAGLFWAFTDVAAGLHVMTAVLIIACPCALALTIPFTFGSLMRYFGRNRFYLKSAEGIEIMSAIDTIVFDKTGTLTTPQPENISFIGPALTMKEQALVKSLVYQSVHPLSRLIYKSFDNSVPVVPIQSEEVPGLGLRGSNNDMEIKIGAQEWIAESSRGLSGDGYMDRDVEGSKVHLSLNGRYKGYFRLQTAYREGLRELTQELKTRYRLIVLSGDHELEKPRLTAIMGEGIPMRFRQTPQDKSHYLESLRRNGAHVMMIGDGLNDIAALKESDFGVAITDQTGAFTPASDAILDARALSNLPAFLALSRKAVKTVYIGFGLSALYNSVGIGLAVAGLISPLLSAILMPLSSVSVVAVSVGIMYLHVALSKKHKNSLSV